MSVLLLQADSTWTHLATVIVGKPSPHKLSAIRSALIPCYSTATRIDFLKICLAADVSPLTISVGVHGCTLSLDWPLAGRSVIIRQDSQRRIFSPIGLRETQSKEEKRMGTRKPHIPHVESLELKTLMSTGASTAPAAGVGLEVGVVMRPLSYHDDVSNPSVGPPPKG